MLTEQDLKRLSKLVFPLAKEQDFTSLVECRVIYSDFRLIEDDLVSSSFPDPSDFETRFNAKTCHFWMPILTKGPFGCGIVRNGFPQAYSVSLSGLVLYLLASLSEDGALISDVESWSVVQRIKDNVEIPTTEEGFKVIFKESMDLWAKALGTPCKSFDNVEQNRCVDRAVKFLSERYHVADDFLKNCNDTDGELFKDSFIHLSPSFGRLFSDLFHRMEESQPFGEKNVPTICSTALLMRVAEVIDRLMMSIHDNSPEHESAGCITGVHHSRLYWCHTHKGMQPVFEKYLNDTFKKTFGMGFKWDVVCHTKKIKSPSLSDLLRNVSTE